MKNLLMAGMLFGMSCVNAYAALPPWAQRSVEFKAILEDQGVMKALPHGSFIQSLEYIGPDLYRVSAGRCTLDVRVKDRPMPEYQGVPMVGPRHFELEVGMSVCTED
ncbi:hypothetical protein FMZ60_01925 [Alcaligenaceae bacterium SJ-26]|nr:hypothetical protein FMZ60_01925 [Alcaligenaceae bacterium SJ-26]